MPSVLDAERKLALLNKAKRSLSEWTLKLNDSPYALPCEPDITLNQRGRIAGAAVLQKKIIRLHANLFVQNQAYFLSDVIPHELAHLAVYAHFGRTKPHGKEWRYIMQEVLGVAPRVRHTMDVEKAGVKSFSYRCACATVKLGATRHNRVMAKKQSYICTKCKQTLVYTDA